MIEQFEQLVPFVQGMFNVPDIVLAVIILCSAYLGAKRGFIRTVMNGIGRIVALFAAAFVAKLLAPVLARMLVQPIIGQIFEVRATELLAAVPELAQGMETQAAEMATAMTQSVAFFILFFILLFAMNLFVQMIANALNLVAKIPPIGALNRLAGFALGGAFGVLLCGLGLLILTIFAPDTFGPLGYLSPEKVAQTSLTAYLLGHLPSIPLF